MGRRWGRLRHVSFALVVESLTTTAVRSDPSEGNAFFHLLAGSGEERSVAPDGRREAKEDWIGSEGLERLRQEEGHWIERVRNRSPPELRGDSPAARPLQTERRTVPAPSARKLGEDESLEQEGPSPVGSIPPMLDKGEACVLPSGRSWGYCRKRAASSSHGTLVKKCPFSILDPIKRRRGNSGEMWTGRPAVEQPPSKEGGEPLNGEATAQQTTSTVQQSIVLLARGNSPVAADVTYKRTENGRLYFAQEIGGDAAKLYHFWTADYEKEKLLTVAETVNRFYIVFSEGAKAGYLFFHPYDETGSTIAVERKGVQRFMELSFSSKVYNQLTAPPTELNPGEDPPTTAIFQAVTTSSAAPKGTHMFFMVLPDPNRPWQWTEETESDRFVTKVAVKLILNPMDAGCIGSNHAVHTFAVDASIHNNHVAESKCTDEYSIELSVDIQRVKVAGTNIRIYVPTTSGYCPGKPKGYLLWFSCNGTAAGLCRLRDGHTHSNKLDARGFGILTVYDISYVSGVEGTATKLMKRNYDLSVEIVGRQAKTMVKGAVSVYVVH